MAKKKKSKRRQPDLPEMNGAGVERPSIPEIDDLAEEYVAVRNKRMKLTTEEVDAKTALHGGMNKHRLASYKFEHEDADGNPEMLEVLVEPGGEETVKVKKVKAPKPDSISNDDDAD